MTDSSKLVQQYNEEDSPNTLRTLYDEKDSVFLISRFLKEHITDPCIVLCIGTDRYIGDCLGPLVGTMLEKMGLSYPVFGTLQSPIHAVNLRKQLTFLEYTYPNHQIIALDACLGTEENIGIIQLKNDCLYPGKGVGKKLPAVGDLSIIGIVDSCNHEEFFFLHNIRLNLVMQMAEIIAKGICEGLK